MTKQNTTSNKVSFLHRLIKQDTYLNSSAQLSDNDNENEKYVQGIWDKRYLDFVY